VLARRVEEAGCAVTRSKQRMTTPAMEEPGEDGPQPLAALGELRSAVLFFANRSAVLLGGNDGGRGGSAPAAMASGARGLWRLLVRVRQVGRRLLLCFDRRSWVLTARKMDAEGGGARGELGSGEGTKRRGALGTRGLGRRRTLAVKARGNRLAAYPERTAAAWTGAVGTGWVLYPTPCPQDRAAQASE
jgi:hypothetical protein